MQFNDHPTAFYDSTRSRSKENRDKQVNFEVKFGIENFQIYGCVVKEIKSNGVVYIEQVKLMVLETLVYGNVAYDTKDRNVYIQNYNLGETKVIHHNGHISPEAFEGKEA